MECEPEIDGFALWSVGKEVTFTSKSTHSSDGVLGRTVRAAKNVLSFKTLISRKLCHLCGGLNFPNCKMGLITIFSCLSLGSCADTVITFHMADPFTSVCEAGAVQYNNRVRVCQTLAHFMRAVILEIVTIIISDVQMTEMRLREVK